jgi:hypothetical protein
MLIYSSTSSARASSPGGTLTPNAFALDHQLEFDRLQDGVDRFLIIENPPGVNATSSIRMKTLLP